MISTARFKIIFTVKLLQTV